MAQYIDKAALVAEIKRLLDRYVSVHTFNYGATQDLNHLLSFIDTLEVKEVDLEREIGFFTTKELLKKRNFSTSVFHLTQSDIDNIAKHFFELGLKAQKEE